MTRAAVPTKRSCGSCIYCSVSSSGTYSRMSPG
nr:MAG TPA: Heat stable enterotoxin [Caudoviricetes sp.]